MKVFVVLAAVACFAQSALSSYAPYYPGAGAYAYGGYNGPLAAPVVTPSGFLADTPEVAAAKAAHLSEVAKASSYAPAAPAYAPAAPAYGYAGAGYAGGYAGSYNGPAAKIVVTPSGFLADTPEVAAAKAAHLSLVAGASRGAYAAPYAAPYAGAYDDGSYKGEGAYYGGAYSGAYAGAYDDGSYKGEGAYGYYSAGQEDDGSYYPYKYEKGYY